MRTWLDEYYEYFIANFLDEINNQLSIAAALDAEQEIYE